MLSIFIDILPDVYIHYRREDHGIATDMAVRYQKPSMPSSMEIERHEGIRQNKETADRLKLPLYRSGFLNLRRWKGRPGRHTGTWERMGRYFRRKIT